MDVTPVNTQALPAGTRIEEFVIERVLGAGGFGMTYLALDTRLGRKVVIKENFPAQYCFRDTGSLTVAPRHTHGSDADNFQWSLDNFNREAGMLASLDHPGIVRVLGSFEAFGTAYFVMPFVEGETLDQLARSRAGDPFTQNELTGLLEWLLDALSYLHGHGIFHRDIKPGNILVTREGRPVLIDFGSARQQLGERSMTVVESAGYTPFEQLQTRGNVGPWSDLYSLAATVVKVMTGEAPPKANDRTMGDPWQPLARRGDLKDKYSPEFLHTLDQALRLPIDERWRNAGDWSAALAGGVLPIVDSHGVPTATTKAERVARKKPSHGLRWSFVAAALVAVTAVGAWHLTRKDHEQVPAAVTVPLTGRLVITSDPLGAELTSNGGEVLGKTPVELTGLAPEQAWQGALTKEGYVPADVKAEVVSGETKLVAPIKIKPQAQKVIVSSEPSDAEVVEDGKVLGRTPWESGPQEVGVGVTLTLRKEGYDDAQVSGEVLFGKSLILQGTLKATPQKVIVTSEPTGAEVVEGEKVLGRVREYVAESGFITFDILKPEQVQNDMVLALRRKTGILGQFTVSDVTPEGGVADQLPGVGRIDPKPGDELILPPPDPSTSYQTPWESTREVGESVALTLRKEGYDDAHVSGEVPFGKSLILQGTLKAKPPKVIVTSEPTWAKRGLDVVKIEDRDYVSVSSIKDFYGFTTILSKGNSLILEIPKKRRMTLTIGSRECLMNDIKFVFTHPVMMSGDKAFISGIDLSKLIDPVLRPRFIKNAENFSTIILDPGHGGKDAGATNSLGTEAKYNLRVAAMTKLMLEKRGFKVVMTRESDRYLSLQERVNLANARTENSLFISIHFNAGDSEARGIETFALSPAGVSHYGRDTIASDYTERAGNEHDSANVALATAVHGSVLRRLGTNTFDRGIKRVRYSVLSGLKHPAILFKAGFMTHQREARLIHKERYQKAIAYAIVDAIARYRNALKPTGSVAAPRSGAR